MKIDVTHENKACICELSHRYLYISAGFTAAGPGFIKILAVIACYAGKMKEIYNGYIFCAVIFQGIQVA